MRVHGLTQLARDVAIHAVVAGPRGLKRVDIKAGADPKIPVIRIAGNARLAWTGVRRNQHDAKFRRCLLRVRLDGKSFFVAGKTGEVIQHRHFSLGRLRRYESAELHRALGFGGVVFVDALLAAETRVLRNQTDVAHQYTTTVRMDSPECIKSKALLMSFNGS